MTPFHVVVASSGACAPLAEAFRSRLEEAWAAPEPIRVTLSGVDHLKTDLLEGVDAVVAVMGSSDDDGPLIWLLPRLEEAAVAVMVLAEGPWEGSAHDLDGALVEPLGADAAMIGAKLHGMLHRRREIDRLREEVRIARRFHGGLQGEMSRMHEEMQLAAIVQREFLPREMPDLCGVTFAALWRPTNYVSGDIYDVARLDDDHVGVFIADAVGHGVPAALMTMVISRALTAKVITGSSYRLVEPSELLDRLNHEMIRRSSNTGRFATGAYALVNCRTRTMLLAGAGHPPPLLYRADGSVVELETPGGLLGVFEDETYDQIEVELAVGDRLLVHSDGFEQAFPRPQADTYERRIPSQRYREAFASILAADKPGDVVEALRRRLDDERGSLHQLDDLTFVCMQAGPLEPNAEAARPTQRATPLRMAT